MTSTTAPIKSLFRQQGLKGLLLLWVLGALLLPSSASHAAPLCSKIPKELPTINAELIFENLPKKGSPEFQEMTNSIRKQIQINSTFAIIDLSKWISENTGRFWYESLLKESSSQIHNNELLFRKGDISQSEPLDLVHLQGTLNLKSWFDDLIKESVENDILMRQTDSLSSFINLRVLPKEDSSCSFHEWHVDGGIAVVTMSFFGQGTEVLGPAPSLENARRYHEYRGSQWEPLCRNCTTTIVSTRHALIFFGSEASDLKIVHPLIHRTPSPALPRSLFVIRY